MSVDAAQYYDKVNHDMLALLWIALVVDPMSVKVILNCFQTMKFYQRSGYGNSKDYFGGPMQGLRWMGLGQGSREASQGWVQMSSVNINILNICEYGL